MGLISSMVTVLAPITLPSMAEVGLDAVVGNLMLWMNSWIGNIGLTVVLFTVFLKLILFPLDFFSRRSMKIYQLKMEKIQPQMEKIKKQYANNKQLMQQKTAALQKKMGASAFASCLPTIVTLVLFIYVFSAFRSYVSYTNFDNYNKLALAYNNAWETAQMQDADGISYTLAEKYGNGTNAFDNATEEEKSVVYSAVSEAYENLGVKFLWVKNIALADVPWTESVAPSVTEYLAGTTSGLSLPGGDKQYKEVMKPIVEEYAVRNADGEITYNDNGLPKTQVNGYLIFPILAVGLSILSQLITTKMQKATNPMGEMTGQKTMMKVMMFIFPLMYLSFALSSSTAFTIYMTINTAITLLLTFLINFIVVKTVRLKEEKEVKTGVGRRNDNVRRTAEQRSKSKAPSNVPTGVGRRPDPPSDTASNKKK